MRDCNELCKSLWSSFDETYSSEGGRLIQVEPRQRRGEKPGYTTILLKIYDYYTARDDGDDTKTKQE